MLIERESRWTEMCSTIFCFSFHYLVIGWGMSKTCKCFLTAAKKMRYFTLLDELVVWQSYVNLRAGWAEVKILCKVITAPMYVLICMEFSSF